MQTPNNNDNVIIDSQQLEDVMEEVFMNLYMYSFYDKAAHKFDTPLFCQSDLFAGRLYKQVMEGKNQVSENPEDFDLVRLGTFDLIKGTFKPCSAVVVAGQKKEE